MEEKKSISIDQFVLRIIAIITMTLDHIGIFLLNYPLESWQHYTGEVFRLVGRIAFPLFALMLAEGMRHSRNKEKYLLRIFSIYALITIVQTVINYGFANRFGSLNFPNPFTDLLLNGLTLYFLTKKKYWKFFALIPAAIVCIGYGCDITESLYSRTVLWFPVLYRSSYSIYGLLITLGFYYSVPIARAITRYQKQSLNIDENTSLLTEKMERRLINIISCLIFFAINVIFYCIKFYPEIGPKLDVLAMSGYLYHMGGFQSYAILAIIPIFLYNGKRGYNSKAFRIISYLYFPVHLIIIFLIFNYAI